jgi:hypothetical protein
MFIISKTLLDSWYINIWAEIIEKYWNHRIDLQLK